jgi:sugar phosphate isomerase/epimerase
MKSWTERLAVCSWSLQPESPEQLIRALKIIGIPRVQLALDPLRENPAVWKTTAAELAAAHIEIVSGMMTAVGEDYTTLESIQRTGGLVPDGTWEQNWINFQRIATLAEELKLKLVTFHAGFLPHDPSDPGHSKLKHRVEQLANLFARHHIELGFETGQETAPTLGTFLSDLGLSQVGVNFDPANMLLYDQGNPVEAVRHLAPWLKQVHLKDAIRTQVPGTWGVEVPVGEGEVDWVAFLQAVDESGFEGYLCFEREAGDQRVADIQAGLKFIQGIESSR